MAKKTGNPGIVDTQRQGITDVPDPAANVAATGKGTARTAVGTSMSSAKNVSGAASPNTKALKKHQSGGGSDSHLGRAAHRSASTADRLGPAFAPRAVMVHQIDPAAGATQANGRIVPSATIRTRASFDSGDQASY